MTQISHFLKVKSAYICGNVYYSQAWVIVFTSSGAKYRKWCYCDVTDDVIITKFNKLLHFPSRINPVKFHQDLSKIHLKVMYTNEFLLLLVCLLLLSKYFVCIAISFVVKLFPISLSTLGVIAVVMTINLVSYQFFPWVIFECAFYFITNKTSCHWLSAIFCILHHYFRINMNQNQR